MPRLSLVIIDNGIRIEAAPGRHRRSCAVEALATVTVAIVAMASMASAAERPKADLPARITQDFWLINTRCAPGCGDLEAGLPRTTYSRLDESSGCWMASGAKAYQGSAVPGVPTTFLIHGNDTTAEWAVEHGAKWYGLMKQKACGRSFRLIVWSWPSEQVVRRHRPDVQIKVRRSDVEAYYLARVLSDLPKGSPLGLVSHSLGCRTASGALQLLAAGPVAGRNLAPKALATWNNGGHRHIRVMMLAPAMDADWLEPGCPRDRVRSAVESILVVANGRDHILKWYSHLYGRHGPEAMGYVGPASTLGGKLKVVDVCCELGRKHDFDLHQVSSPVCQCLAEYTFLRDAPAAAHPLGNVSCDAKTLRTWTDASGKYQIEARFVEFKEGTVRMQRANGRYVHIAADLLCAEDRKFVSNQPEVGLHDAQRRLE